MIYDYIKEGMRMTEKNKNIAVYDHFKRNIDPKVYAKIRDMEFESEEMPLEKFLEICELLEIDVDYEYVCKNY